ncbi:MAG: CRTAC1 family protein [Phycisphaerales bacterium]|nr:CRTAC1 family protein [Phycisphaerales bacterium]
MRTFLGNMLLTAILLGCGDERHTEAPPAVASAAATSSPWFTDVSDTSGIDFTWVSGHHEQFLMPEIIGGGVALLDIDGDGLLDIYFVQGGYLDPNAPAAQGSPPTNRMYRNAGDWSFEDVTDTSGAADAGYGQGVATGDIDNDGDVDIYITNVGPNTLLLNDGTGVFTDVSDQAGVAHPGWGASASFLDANADGLLDLFVTNYVNWNAETELECFSVTGQDYCSPKNYDSPAIDVLYLNQGNGTFKDVSRAAGITAATGNGLGIACVDFDGDGRIDIFVANDGTQDQLWHNRGNGTFEDIGLLAGCALDDEGKAKAGMGVTVSDTDDDGDIDLLVCNLTGESDSFFRNEGSYFVDATAAVGLKSTSKPFTRFGMGWMDFNNDGFLDLYEANGRVLRNTVAEGTDPYAQENMILQGSASGRFSEVLPRGGVGVPQSFTSRAAAFGDLDNDGAVDIVVVNRDAPATVLRNTHTQDGHWIRFRALDASGRDALGAVLTAKIGQRNLTRPVLTGYSYLAANDPRVHLGLGPATAVDEVTIRWLDGDTERFGPFDSNATHEIRRGEGRTN